jgi:endonuclease YncB( thermonuclease family)
VLRLLHPIGVGRALILLLTAASGGACAAEPVLAFEDPGVVDGDGLMFGPIPVRLHGIDAPEITQTCARVRCPRPAG